LHEINEVLDDSLKQTALLLADRDLATALPSQPGAGVLAASDTESMLVAIARRPDGTLLFTSEPEVSLRFDARPGPSVQQQNGMEWDVFTVVQSDRAVQVAQPVEVRREVAAESASQLLLPLTLLVLLIGGLLVEALRRGLRPLVLVNAALKQRNANSLEPLNLRGVPREVLPLVLTLNELLDRLATAFEAQRSFVANAAHELRSPVTALQLQVQVLERSVDPTEKAEAMSELAAGSARMRRLIEQLLRLSSAAPDTGASPMAGTELVSLSAIVKEVVIRQSTEAERRLIDLGARVGSELTVCGNAAQLEILLNNLVENAIRYTGAGGIVDVVADELEGSPSLRVFDDGPGVSLEDRPRVFERFYRSRDAVASAESGSGLGLAIVKAIADGHGATVSLHTGRHGRGLEVRVVFPAPAEHSGPRLSVLASAG
jgi:signal transduction histidine kinase